MSFLKKYFTQDNTIAAYCVVLALTMVLGHGLTKLQIYFDSGKMYIPTVLGMGKVLSFLSGVIIGELLAPLALALGFMTRPAAAMSAFTMFVAAFVFHAGDPFSKKEHAFLFMIGFLIFVIMGSGKYSLNNWIKSKIKKPLPKWLDWFFLG